MKVNWKSGLLRLWIVSSVVWALYQLWGSDLSCPLEFVGIETGAGPWCAFQNAEPWRYYSELLFRIVAVPVITLLLGLAALWVVKGFGGRPEGKDQGE
ncbi:hypothetical protein H7H48_02310 [Nitratireductor sp. B36]|uniref:hypothetical protein n=1 Tax=Nitratireductor sp. B36 TaxID=2762059 RepID=UPI001E5551F1|nr:hypothetical protein [Nitratireductor sp. B36]MCC5777870.1 hypothetical protein [Nitratireductor sp. B36]